MARPRDADSAETMEKILAATLEILREQAEPKPPALRSVASRADVSLGTIRYYFSNKDDLLEACLDGYYVRLSKLGQTLIAETAESKDGRNLVETAARALYRFSYDERGLLRLRIATNSQRGELHPRRQRDFMGALLQEAARGLQPFVGVDELEARLSIQALTSIVVRFALLSESEVKWLTDDEGESARQAIEEFVVRAACRMLLPS